MKHVLIIGASRGLGLEFVRQYREAGDRVVATARSDEGLAALQAAVISTGLPFTLVLLVGCYAIIKGLMSEPRG